MSDHYTGLSITQQEHERLAAAVSGVGAADGGEEKEEGGSGAAEEKEGREMPDASNPYVVKQFRNISQGMAYSKARPCMLPRMIKGGGSSTPSIYDRIRHLKR